MEPAARVGAREGAADRKDGGDLDLGCVAATDFVRDNVTAGYQVLDGSKPATAFLFRLISDLQFSGTVPMIDIQAYAQWLAK